MSVAYEVVVSRGERFWLVEVPEIRRTTQARALREVEPMARDLIAVMEEVDPESIELAVRYDWPPEPLAHWVRAARYREEAAERQAEAAREARTAARELRDLGLTVREIGTVLEVSHQRAAQLVGSE